MRTKNSWREREKEIFRTEGNSGIAEKIPLRKEKVFPEAEGGGNNQLEAYQSCLAKEFSRRKFTEDSEEVEDV